MMRHLISIFIVFIFMTGCQRLTLKPDEFYAEFNTKTKRYEPEEMYQLVAEGKCTKLRKGNETHTGLTVTSETHEVARRVDTELEEMGANALVVDYHAWIPHTWGTELTVDYTGYRCK